MTYAESGPGAALPRRFGYRRPWAKLVPFLFPVFGVFAVLLIVQTAAGNAPVWFTVLWVGVLAWNAYWFLYRLGDEIVVEGGFVSWHAPLATRRVPLAHLTGNRTWWTNMQSITVADERSLLVFTNLRGWNDFLATLAAADPGTQFAPSRGEKMLGAFAIGQRSGYFAEW